MRREREHVYWLYFFYVVFFSSSFDKSLTIVAGLQLIYTNFSGLNFNMLFIVVSSKPLLGGSTNTAFELYVFHVISFPKLFLHLHK